MKTFIKNIACLGLLTISQLGWGQQDPTYTMYAYNMNVINPAFAGSVEGSQLTSNFRSQWVGVPDSPEVQSFSFATSVGERVGLGASVVNSSVFVLGETDIYLDFSYRLPLSRFTDLYLGIKAGGSSVNIDLNRAEVIGDPLFTENFSRFSPNVGTGAYLKGRRFWLSVSAPALLKSERFEKENGIVTNATDRLHLFAGGGYTFFPDGDITFTPSVMTRTVSSSPLSMDLTGMVGLYDRVELGISHRLGESFSGILFFKAAQWADIGYAYEGAITEVADYSKGTHEIMLRFRW